MRIGEVVDRLRSRDQLRRAHQWLRGSTAGLAVVAVVVGLGSGLGAVVFRWLIQVFTLAFSGYADYSAAGRVANPNLPWLGPFFVILAPVLGGLLYGPLVARFAPEARGHGVPEVMLAVAERGGRIRPAVAVVKSLASALCIGSGGSVGREGPIVQIGSALGSTLGQLLRVPESRLRLLVACGAAGGVSATFNAPIAGVFFALEIILRDFEAELFGVVVLASVSANVVARAFFGSRPFLELPDFALVSNQEAFLYLGLGALAAVVGLLFMRALYGLEDIADRLWRGPEALRPAAGGLLLGLGLFALPQMYGVGYPVLQGAIEGRDPLAILLLLLGAKIMATSLTIAIGGSGGVFAPSLFMGATLGTAYGAVMHGLFPGITAAPGAYGIVGMGAVFAAAARAPITAVLIIFELTGDYQIILPLMFAVAIAAGIATLSTGETIYTLKLRRRGIELRRGRGVGIMELITVAEAMASAPPALRADLALGEIVARFDDQRTEALPVVGASGAFTGVVGRAEVEEAMRDNAIDATAGGLAMEVTPLRDGQTLADALPLLVHEHPGLPVVGLSGELVGWLNHQDVLRAYHSRLMDAAKGIGASAAAGFKGLEDLRGYRVVELDLGPGRPAGLPMRDVAWPPASLVIAIRRRRRMLVPRGDTMLEAGDRLTVLVPEAAAAGLLDSLASTPIS